MHKCYTAVEFGLVVIIILIVTSLVTATLTKEKVKDFLNQDVNSEVKMTSKIVSLSYDSLGGNIVVICEDGSIWYRSTQKGSFKEANSNNFIERKFDAESKSGHN